MISKTSGGCGLASASSVKTELFQEAGAFCQRSGKDMEILSSAGKDGIVMVRCAGAEVQFSCLAKVAEGSPEYVERKRRLEARLAREAAGQASETIVVSPPPLIVTAPAPASPRPALINCTSTKIGNTVDTACR